MAKKKGSQKAGKGSEKPTRLFFSRKPRAMPYIPRFAGKFVSKKDLLNLKEIKGQFPYMKDSEILSEYNNGEFSQAEQPPYFTPIWEAGNIAEIFGKVTLISEGIKETFSNKKTKGATRGKGVSAIYRLVRYYNRLFKASGQGSGELAKMSIKITENEDDNSIVIDFSSIDKGIIDDREYEYEDENL